MCVNPRILAYAKKHTTEEIINKLREAEVIIAPVSTVVETARRLKQPETEKNRPKRAGAELTLDNQILKEAVEGNF